MQKVRQRVLMLLLICTIVFGTFPLSVFAEEGNEIETTDSGTSENEDEPTDSQVPKEAQLSQLIFRNGLQASKAEFALQPAFDPEVKEYTVVVPDSVSQMGGFCVWATLADTASGSISVVYRSLMNNKDQTVKVTSGKATGQVVNGAFKNRDFTDNTLTVKVGDIEAYTIHVVRQATLSALSLADQNGNAINCTPGFGSSTYIYSAEADKNAVLTISPTAVASGAVVTVNGKEPENGSVTITPEWNAEQTATVEITVGGGAAQSTTYTIQLIQAELEIERLEITSPPEKTEYLAGDIFDPTGLEVRAYYTNGTSQVIDNDELTYSPADILTVDNDEIQITYENISVVQKITVLSKMSGLGTSENPYLITSVEDLNTIRTEVSKGNSFKDCHFKVTQDLTFDTDWIPIGCLKEGMTTTENGVNILPFSGNIDGNGHTFTYAAGCKPLFNYVREASVSNLNIMAPFMDGYALVEQYTVDYGEDGRYAEGTGGSYQAGCPDTISITNVTLKSGSVIKKGGYIGGFASGGNTVRMTDCVVEKGVKIGCNADGSPAGNSYVGSFAGMVSGIFKNCVSYADVYGVNFVGGLIGYKGQSMGLFEVTNCQFHGSVIATGNSIGGIVGGGYAASSAPNTMCVVIEDCLCDGAITGADRVGGILGSESAIQCWDNGIGRIRNNSFKGKLNASGEYVGGVIGYMASLNRYTIVENNYYAANSCSDGVGIVVYVDTSSTTHESDTGATYFDTSKALPGIGGVAKMNHNREDDPLGADKDKLFRTDKPEESYVIKLEISGNYKKEYVKGEALDTSDMIFIAIWSDGTKTSIDLSQIEFLGFTSEKEGVTVITAKYGDVSCKFEVKVNAKSEKNTVNKADAKTDTKKSSGSGSTGSSSSKATQTTQAKTGDSTNIWLPIMVLCVAAAGAATCVAVMKKKKNEEDEGEK